MTSFSKLTTWSRVNFVKWCLFYVITFKSLNKFVAHIWLPFLKRIIFLTIKQLDPKLMKQVKYSSIHAIFDLAKAVPNESKYSYKIESSLYSNHICSIIHAIIATYLSNKAVSKYKWNWYDCINSHTTYDFVNNIGPKKACKSLLSFLNHSIGFYIIDILLFLIPYDNKNGLMYLHHLTAITSFFEVKRVNIGYSWASYSFSWGEKQTILLNLIWLFQRFSKYLNYIYKQLLLLLNKNSHGNINYNGSKLMKKLFLILNKLSLLFKFVFAIYFIYIRIFVIPHMHYYLLKKSAYSLISNVNKKMNWNNNNDESQVEPFFYSRLYLFCIIFVFTIGSTIWGVMILTKLISVIVKAIMNYNKK